MMIFQLPIFLVPPQDLVPYAQRVVRVMGAAALHTHTHTNTQYTPQTHNTHTHIHRHTHTHSHTHTHTHRRHLDTNEKVHFREKEDQGIIPNCLHTKSLYVTHSLKPVTETAKLNTGSAKLEANSQCHESVIMLSKALHFKVTYLPKEDICWDVDEFECLQ